MTPPAHAAVTSSPRKELGQNTNAELSATSVGSSSNKPRRSFTGESSDPATLAAEPSFGSESGGKDGKDESRGLAGWIKHKYREAKETAEQRRNKSPPADRPIGGTTSPPNPVKAPEATPQPQAAEADKAADIQAQVPQAQVQTPEQKAPQ